MPVLATKNGKRAAVKALKKRRKNKPEEINNSSLPVGSPMYFYCISCGHISDSLPESYTCLPKNTCDECYAMKELGWLE